MFTDKKCMQRQLADKMSQLLKLNFGSILVGGTIFFLFVVLSRNNAINTVLSLFQPIIIKTNYITSVLCGNGNGLLKTENYKWHSFWQKK